MKNNKLKQIVYELGRKGEVFFYLYNIKYKIEMLNDDYYLISNSGSFNAHKYHGIRNLFEEYLVYGSSLLECLDDIILLK